jgi:sulfatase modifying factor 1
MKPFSSWNILVAIFCIAAGITASRASITIDVVHVGNAGNPDDATGYGGVAYDYAIGKYEVTNGQYAAFLTSVATTADPYGLYDGRMGSDPNMTGTGIWYSRNGGINYYGVVGNPNKPIMYVSWFDAARFSNWMANGQPTGAQTATTTENGAYTLNGATSGVNFTKNAVNPNNGSTVSWWIPSEDEWYKAAYYDPSVSGPADDYWMYPTQSDSVPGNTIGNGPNQANYFTTNYSTVVAPYLTNGGAFSSSASFYGTFDQGGNVYEWNDAVITGDTGTGRGIRGGGYSSSSSSLRSTSRDAYYPTDAYSSFGFRVASVPEPSTTLLMFMAGVGVLGWKRWRSGS